MEPNTSRKTCETYPNLEISTMGIYEHKGIMHWENFVLFASKS